MKHNKILALFMVIAMIATLVGCAEVSTPAAVEGEDPPAVTEEPVQPPEAAETPDVEAEAFAEHLSEEDIAPYIEFPDELYVLRMDEPIEPMDIASENVAEENENLPEETEEADESEDEEVSEEDLAGEDDSPEETSPDVDPDPMGYIAALNIIDENIVLDVSYDSYGINVTEAGDYELFYFVYIDRESYDLAEAGEANEEADNIFDESANPVDAEVDNEDEQETSTEPVVSEVVTVVRPVHVIEEEVFSLDAITEALDSGEKEVVDINEVLVAVYTHQDEAAEKPSAEDVKEDEAPEAEPDDAENVAQDAGATTTTKTTDTSNTTKKQDTTPSATATPKPSNTNTGTGTGTGTSAGGNNSGNTSNTTSPTPTPHTHTWVTETVSDGYYESRKVGTTQVQVGTRTVTDSEAWDEWIGEQIICLSCGTVYSSVNDWGDYDTCGGGYTVKNIYTHHNASTHEEPVYETQDVYEDVWVDTSYTIEKCSTCGATR